jgi:methyl-accepting chemotaxis protein
MLKKISNIKLGVKIFGGFIFSCLIMISVGFIGYWGLNDIEDNIEDLTDKTIPTLQVVYDLKTNIRNMTVIIRSLTIKESSLEFRDRQYKNLEQTRKEYSEELNKYEKIDNSNVNQKEFTEFKLHLVKWKELNNKFFDLCHKYDTEPNDVLYKKILEISTIEIYEASRKAVELLDKLIEVNIKKTEIAKQNAKKDIKNNIKIMVISIGIGIIFCCLLGYIITKVVTKPLNRVVDAAKQFATGDFDKRLDVVYNKDEIGIASTYLNKAFDIVVDKMFWFTSLLDSVKYPIFVADNNRKIIYMNKALKQVIQSLGISQERFMNDSCNNINATICNTHNCAIEQLKRGVSQVNFQLLKLGNDKYFSAESSYMVDIKGNEIGFIEVISDITEQVQLKKAAEEAAIQGRQNAADSISKVVERATSASEELSAQIEQSSRGAEEQRTRVSEAVTAIEEMSATVIEVAKNAGVASKEAELAKDGAIQAEKSATQVEQSLQLVHIESVKVKDFMIDLQKQSSKITQVTEVINDIADQTNLLALNAAIEAARAGDAGRGFAVVADEVRKLAVKTQEATKNAEEIVDNVQSGIITGVKVVDKVNDLVTECVNKADEAGKAMCEIVNNAQSVLDQTNSVATATEEQSSATDEINRTMGDIDRISSETTRAMMESAKAVSELAQQTHELNSIVNSLRS